MTRRAKIVCTLGPATDSLERCRALVEAGMDVARLNFSHGAHSEHGRRFHEVRQAAAAAGRNVAVLADLQGPKIRLGRFAEGPVEWATGERIRITVEDCEGTHDRVSTTYKQLAVDVRPGDKLLVDDGNVALIAVEVENGTDVVCDVTEGGVVSNNKGLSLPGVAVSVPAMSEKDAEDLEFALRLGVDFVALSFVRNPEDVKLVHRIMDEVGVRRPVIAKIEKPEAVERLNDIVLAFDGIMVARGDLGVEMPLEMVPVVQKRAIQICRDNAKPVIVATQMLESMITHSRPTRAEASDVANAVIDGADAVMLSGETSVGKYPVQAVATMSRIITTVEASGTQVTELRHVPRTPGGAIVKAAKDIGDALGAVALVAFTQTGDTARRLSRLQPTQRILVFTPVEQVQRQMALLWGAEAHLVWTVKTTDEMVRQVDSALLNRGVCHPHDLVIVVAGTPPATPGATNTIRVHRIGDVLRHDI
ncbi:MAG: pyruvate kinase [Pseudonocardiales bacterium]|nr:pyruvate kinase [Pseudonocardiales bacterium]MDT4944510.1 pyruvate kinase [Pseudonocardiales bacterium]